MRAATIAAHFTRRSTSDLALPPPMRTRFILINTSHAGNVGAAARAMRTMGFADLVLVAPRWANVLRREETIQRASGALDVLRDARIVDTLDEALDGMTHLCATAMIARDFGPPTRTPRAHLEAFAAVQASRSDTVDVDESGIAFLFGSERFGMKNEDVYRCHVALTIPTDPKFGSLNLAAAVQLVAYEWRLALGGFASAPAAGNATALTSAAALLGPVADGQGALPRQPAPDSSNVLADARQVAGMLDHWERSLADIGFLDPAAPKKLMPRLQQLFNRAALTREEIHILRGVAKAMAEAAQPSR